MKFISRIILLANDRVGLEVAKYLKQKRERIVALVLHPRQNAKWATEIQNLYPDLPVFYADKLRNPTTLERIKKLNPDFAISAWFGYILKPEFLNIFPYGAINFHNSYLPHNRGKYPHVWAIYKGSVYGVTLHYIDPGIDTGAIISRREIRVAPTDIAGTLYEKSLKEIVDLFKKTWPKIKSNKIKIIKQSKSATYHFAREVEKIDFIDLGKKQLTRDVINQLRARSFKNRSYAYFLDKGKKIYAKIELSEKSQFE